MIFQAIALLTALAPHAAVTAQERELHRAVFELCPLVVEGRLRLDDRRALAAVGYRRAKRWGKALRAERGLGTDRVQLISSPGKAPTCMVMVGGPNNDRLFEAAAKAAEERGFKEEERLQSPVLQFGTYTGAMLAVASE